MKSQILMGGCHGEDLINGLRVRTIYLEDGYYYDCYDSEGDTGWLTYIDDHFGEHSIEYYNDEGAAAQGHAKWVEYVTNLNYYRRITSYDQEGNLEYTFKLWPIGSDIALKEQLRREHAAEVAERKRKLEAKRSMMETYKQVADAFKGFPFKKIAGSQGSRGSIQYLTSYDYMDITSKDDGGFVRSIPHMRYGYWEFMIRDPAVIEKYESKFIELASAGWLSLKYVATDNNFPKICFRVTVDPWTSQKWIEKSGSDSKLGGLD